VTGGPSQAGDAFDQRSFPRTGRADQRGDFRDGPEIHVECKVRQRQPDVELDQRDMRLRCRRISSSLPMIAVIAMRITYTTNCIAWLSFPELMRS